MTSRSTGRGALLPPLPPRPPRPRRRPRWVGWRGAAVLAAALAIGLPVALVQAGPAGPDPSPVPTSAAPTRAAPTSVATPDRSATPTTSAPSTPTPSPAPSRPPRPYIAGIGPAGTDRVPVGVFGTPVRLTGTRLRAIDSWAVDGVALAPVDASDTEIVLVVPPGRLGRVAWTDGAERGSLSLDLAAVAPAVSEARVVVWGEGCPEPARTGLVHLAGRPGRVAVTRSDGTALPVHALGDGGLLVTTGPDAGGGLVVGRGDWRTVVPVSGGVVDVGDLSALPRIAGADCPLSERTSRIGIVGTDDGDSLTRVLTPDRRALRFVPLGPGAIAVLLPRGGDAGTRTVRLVRDNGNSWTRPLTIVAPVADAGTTLLAEQMTARS